MAGIVGYGAKIPRYRGRRKHHDECAREQQRHVLYATLDRHGLPDGPQHVIRREYAEEIDERPGNGVILVGIQAQDPTQ